MNAAGRPRRADSQRNYVKLLAAADTAFAQHGTDTSLEAIAREAGVAIGTLYAHFPNRAALIGALLRDRHAELFDHGERLLAETPAAEALTLWVRAVVAHAATYRGLAAVLVATLKAENSELHDACQRMTSLGEQVTDKAAEAGVLRSGATAADVFALIGAAAWIREQMSAEQADRLVTLTLEGLLPD